jgi:hypothetical protein
VTAPGGRTTTHRLGRPSFGQGWGVLHQLETKRVHEEADRWVVVADDDGDEAEIHRASIRRPALSSASRRTPRTGGRWAPGYARSGMTVRCGLRQRAGPVGPARIDPPTHGPKIWEGARSFVPMARTLVVRLPTRSAVFRLLTQNAMMCW